MRFMQGGRERKGFEVKETERETDRKTDRQTDGLDRGRSLTDRNAGAYRQTERQTYIQTRERSKAE